MELSLFLAKLIGLYFLIVAGLWIFRKAEFERFLNDFVSSVGLTGFSGIISLVLGLMIVIGHPIWEVSWRGLITLIGLLFIIQGILRIGFNSNAQGVFKKWIDSRGYWVVLAILIVLGGYLTYNGFTQ